MRYTILIALFMLFFNVAPSQSRLAEPQLIAMNYYREYGAIEGQKRLGEAARQKLYPYTVAYEMFMNFYGDEIYDAKTDYGKKMIVANQIAALRCEVDRGDEVAKGRIVNFISKNHQYYDKNLTNCIASNPQSEIRKTYTACHVNRYIGKCMEIK